MIKNATKKEEAKIWQSQSIEMSEVPVGERKKFIIAIEMIYYTTEMDKSND